MCKQQSKSVNIFFVCAIISQDVQHIIWSNWNIPHNIARSSHFVMYTSYFTVVSAFSWFDAEELFRF